MRRREEGRGGGEEGRGEEERGCRGGWFGRRVGKDEVRLRGIGEKVRRRGGEEEL